MSVTLEATAIRPFTFEFPETELEELRRRIVATRWPEKETVADHSQGTQLATIQSSRATGRRITTGARSRRS
jgi:Epoxide hydrolase N terminus